MLRSSRHVPPRCPMRGRVSRPARRSHARPSSPGPANAARQIPSQDWLVEDLSSSPSACVSRLSVSSGCARSLSFFVGINRQTRSRMSFDGDHNMVEGYQGRPCDSAEAQIGRLAVAELAPVCASTLHSFAGALAVVQYRLGEGQRTTAIHSEDAYGGGGGYQPAVELMTEAAPGLLDRTAASVTGPAFCRRLIDRCIDHVHWVFRSQGIAFTADRRSSCRSSCSAIDPSLTRIALPRGPMAVDEDQRPAASD